MDLEKLPREKTPPEHELQSYAQLWYGREKIGKTAVAAEFPETLFLLCEPGGKGLSLYKVDVNDWKTFKKACALLEKTKRFKNIVVDTADLAFKYCQDSVLKRLGILHPSEEDYGKAYSMIKDEFHLQCSRLLKLGRGVIFISHTVEKELRQKGGQVQHRTIPTLPNQARAVLEPMVDIWGHMEYGDDGERLFRLVGDRHVSAGHRLGELHFRGYESIPMGASPAEAYRNFVAAFNNQKLGEGGAAAVPFAEKQLKVKKVNLKIKRSE